MFYFFRRSLRNKLLITFMAIGFLPFLTLLVYTLFLSENKIVNKIVLEQTESTNVVIKLIDNHLNSLIKEVEFLSSLDLMDDLIAEDIDKRISRLLSQKVKDLDLDITLMAANPDSIVVASSDLSELHKKFNIDEQKTLKNKTYIQGKSLYVYSKIYASFDGNKEIGTLLLRYNLNNFRSYLTHHNGVHSYIINPKNETTIGEDLSLSLNFNKGEESIIDGAHVVVYKKLSSIGDGWFIVYAVDKSVALAFLYDFIRFMLYISIIIFAAIVYISVRYSKGMVKPIENLTSITNEITNTRNYSVKLDVESSDEIAMLTHSFNKMIKTTSDALEKLEEENALRLKRFIQLIEVFNSIIQTKTEEECIDISIKEIKKLTNKSSLKFFKDQSLISTESIAIYVSDFEKDKKVYFGSIELDVDSFEDKNEKSFYNSIAAMITLQLERIRLINRTLSVSSAKSAFISSMSHELRTPLNSIIGSTQYMLVYENLSDEQLDSVANIESSAQYLLEMINDILDIAKIEAGKMDVNMESVDILELVENTYTMLEPLADDKELAFRLSSEEFENKSYKTDPKMFMQILINLISNAIKFTKEGSIDIKLYSDDQNIYVSVKDSGIGISKDDMKMLFNDFTQVENVMQKKHKGTGLGLSLSKKLANMLDGNVELKSEGIGHGTTSIFSIRKIF